MALNGIDISNWQAGIDLAAVPCDFAICKATQGTTYTSPDCARQVELARSVGKLFGVYHYVAGGNAQAEADFFVDSVLNWMGKGTLCVDWEQNQNAAWGDLSYLDAVCRRIVERTGIIPLIYASKAVFPWDTAKLLNAGTWVAQYADNDATGYQDSPWNEGAYSCSMRQYTSNGRIAGYGGPLDLNKFYGDRSAWQAYARPDGAEPEPAPEPVEPDTSTAPAGRTIDLIAYIAEHGLNDQARRDYCGSRYDEVQNMINHIHDASADELADEVWEGVYGNDPLRSTVLDICGRAEEVRAVVNGGGSGDSTVYTVVAGDTLSAIAAHYGVTVDAIVAANGIQNPNLIYTGQRLSIPIGGTVSTKHTYTVQSGDTLSGIAAKFGTTYQEIAAANGIADPNRIYPGQQLVIG